MCGGGCNVECSAYSVICTGPGTPGCCDGSTDCGCDNVCGSTTQYDLCGVCGGDNTSCDLGCGVTSGGVTPAPSMYWPDTDGDGIPAGSPYIACPSGGSTCPDGNNDGICNSGELITDATIYPHIPSTSINSAGNYYDTCQVLNYPSMVCIEDSDVDCISNLFAYTDYSNGIPSGWDCCDSGTLDECGVCDGEGVQNPYCNCSGDQDLNGCGCGIVYIPNTTCCPSEGNPDCAGECGGQATEDCAGECGGGASLDCSGTCQGNSYTDNCGNCVCGTGIGNGTGGCQSDACSQDCSGEWGGSCTVCGCTNIAAENYDATILPGCDDGSCEFYGAFEYSPETVRITYVNGQNNESEYYGYFPFHYPYTTDVNLKNIFNNIFLVDPDLECGGLPWDDCDSSNFPKLPPLKGDTIQTTSNCVGCTGQFKQAGVSNSSASTVENAVWGIYTQDNAEHGGTNVGIPDASHPFGNGDQICIDPATNSIETQGMCITQGFAGLLYLKYPGGCTPGNCDYSNCPGGVCESPASAPFNNPSGLSCGCGLREEMIQLNGVVGWLKFRENL